MPNAHRTILIVNGGSEADHHVCETSLSQNRPISWAVMVEADRMQALTLCQSQQIDGILLDLPDSCSSVDYINDLKRYLDNRCPPIVVVNGDHAETAVGALKAGAADYLVRDNITVDSLRLALETAIEQWDRSHDCRRTKRALQESDERLKLALEGSGGGLWDWNIATGEDYLSQRWLQILGYEEADLPGDYSSWERLIHPDDKSWVMERLQAHLYDSSVPYEFEYRMLSKSGEWKWIANYGKVIKRDDHGHPLRMAGIHLDIHDRKRIEFALQQSQRYYQTLFESIDEGFCIIKMLFDENDRPVDYRFLGVNSVFEQQTGLQQVIGKTVLELMPDLEDHWIQAYAQVALTGKPTRFENRVVSMNRWFDVYACRVGEPEAHEVAVVFKDISDRKQVESERERLLAREQAARAVAERANQIKDEFLAILSHELRSPLNPILGWSKLLQTRKLDAANTAKALSTIERNAELQTRLIDDLLDVAKILRGRLKLEQVPVSLVSVIESAIDTVRIAATVKSIDLQFSISELALQAISGSPFHRPPSNFTVLGDGTRLQQVIWNLLSNAVKFTPEGGRVDIGLEAVNNHIQITVKDTGRGIHPDFIPYLFTTFRLEDASTTREHGGLGLGLSIARYLVEAHGGGISAESPGEGQGSTFTVTLPLLNAQGDALSNQASQSERSPQRTGSLKGLQILAVDDNADARELLFTLLVQYGAEVRVKVSAAEALEALASFQPHVLISDIGMPVMDGYDLIQRLRTLPAEQGGQTPEIALTAYVREEDQQKVLESGYQRHLPKPIQPERLLEAILDLTSPQ